VCTSTGGFNIVFIVQKRGSSPNYGGIFLMGCLGGFDIVFIVQKCGSSPNYGGIFLCGYT
jgi:hypothetical protein